MAELVVKLPDELAQRARNAGLLSDSAIQRLLEEAMRREACSGLSHQPALQSSAIVSLNRAAIRGPARCLPRSTTACPAT